MRVEGRRAFPVDSETLWYLLHDPYTLRRAIPDCVSLEVVAPDKYQLVLETRIGQNVERLTGGLRLTPLDQRRGFEFEATGGNHSGLLTARGRVNLEPEDDESATLVYAADIEVAGEFVRISSRLLQTTLNAACRRSLETLEDQATLRTGGYSTTMAEPEVSDAARPVTFVARLLPYRRYLFIGSILLAAFLLARGLGRGRADTGARQTSAMPAGAMSDRSRPAAPGTLARSRAWTDRERERLSN